MKHLMVIAFVAIALPVFSQSDSNRPADRSADWQTCRVNGVENKTAQDCVAYFRSQSVAGGAIYDNQPSDLTTNFLVFRDQNLQPGFKWNLGVGRPGTNPSSGNPIAWIIEQPLTLHSGASILGQGIVGWNSDMTTGTLIMSGSRFPGALTSPYSSGNNLAWPTTAPTIVCNKTGGSINTVALGGATSVYVTLVEENNLQGVNPPVPRQVKPTPGPTLPSGEASCTIPAGTTTGSITITAPVTLTNPNPAARPAFDAQDYAVCASLVSGKESCGCTSGSAGLCDTQSVSCAAPGVVDFSAGCRLGSGNNATLTAIPSVPHGERGACADAGTCPGRSGIFVPPVSDLSSVMVVVGHMNGAYVGTDNTYGAQVKNLTLLCGPNGYSDTGTAATPSVAMWLREAQEVSQISNVQFMGPCYGASQYVTRGNMRIDGMDATSPHLWQSPPAPNATFYNLVFDGFYGAQVSAFAIYSSTFNSNARGGNARANIYVRGYNAFPSGYSLHMENNNGKGGKGGDNVIVDWGGNFECNSCVGFPRSEPGYATFHRTSSGNSMNIVASPTQAGGPRVIIDDARSLVINPGAVGVPVTYDSRSYVAKAVLTSAYTNSNAATFSSVGDALGVEANLNYKLLCHGFYQSSAPTAALSWQFTGPASPAQFEWSEHAVTTGGARAVSYDATANGFSTPLTPSTGTATAADQEFRIEAYLRNGPNDGVIQPQARPNGAGTLTIQPGMSCELTPQNTIP